MTEDWADRPAYFEGYVVRRSHNLYVLATRDGALLGRVVRQKSYYAGRRAGTLMTLVAVEGNNDARYLGRYGASSGNYVRVRRLR